MDKVKTPLEAARRAFSNWRISAEGKMFRCTLFAKQGGRCSSCYKHMVLRFDGIQTPNTATLDHRVPLVESLQFDKYNLDLICQRCNVIKANKPDIRIAHGTVVHKPEAPCEVCDKAKKEWQEVESIFIKEAKTWKIKKVENKI